MALPEVYETAFRCSRDQDELAAALTEADSNPSIILSRLSELIRLRRQQQTFHPNAVPFTMQLGLELFGIWRQSTDRCQDVFSISNVTRERQSLELASVNLVSTDQWPDPISGARIEDGQATLKLSPYQTVWLTNR